MTVELRVANKLKEARKIETRLNFDWRGKTWLPPDVLQKEEAEISSNIDARLDVLGHLREITKAAKAVKLSLPTLWASGGALREAYEENNSVTSEAFWELARKNLPRCTTLINSSTRSQTSTDDTTTDISHGRRPADWKRRVIKLRSSRDAPESTESTEAPRSDVNTVHLSSPGVFPGISPGYLLENETSNQLKQRIEASESKFNLMKSQKDHLNARIAALGHAEEKFDVLQGEITTTFDCYHASLSNNLFCGIETGSDDTTGSTTHSNTSETNNIVQPFQEDCAQFKLQLDARRQIFKDNIEEENRNLAEVIKESERLNVEINLLKDICQLKENMERHPDAWKM